MRDEGSTSWDDLVRELEAFYDLSIDLFCVATSDGYFRRVGGGWQEALGYSPAELEGKPWLSLVHPDDVASNIEAARALGMGDLVAFRVRYRHRDGTYRELTWRAQQWSAGVTYAIGRVSPTVLT